MGVSRRDQQHPVASSPQDARLPEMVENHVVIEDWARGIDHGRHVRYADLVYRLPHQISDFLQFVLR
jgi:hypothetical protein